MKKFYLERLGVQGYSYAHERAMHASIMTGSPLLIIGTMGEAKTYAAKSIARLLFGNPVLGEAFPFQKIACDKVNIDDLTGYMNIPMLAEGRVEYIKSPQSIWDKQFVLMDEISRATPKIQNRLLELVYERELQGLPTDEWWVWATMNPLTYAGSQPLDLALAGRFAYIIMPRALVTQDSARSERLIEKVIMQHDASLTPAIARWDGHEDSDRGNVIDPTLCEEYESFMIESKDMYKSLWATWGENVAKYVAAFADTLYAKGAGFALDTRRCKMIAINIIANIAIASTHQQRALTIKEVKDLAYEVIPISLPWAACGTKETDKFPLGEAHKIASGFLDKGDNLIYRVVTERDTLNKAILLLEHRESVDPMHAVGLVRSLLQDVNIEGDIEAIWKEQATRFATKLALTQVLMEIENAWPDTLSLLAREYPIELYRMPFEDKHVSIEINVYKDAVAFGEYYDRMSNSKNARELAAFYFAITPPKSDSTKKVVYTSDQVLKRHEIALKEIKRVSDALSIYIPVKAAQHVNNVPGNIADDWSSIITNLSPDTNQTVPTGNQTDSHNGAASDPAAQIQRTFTIV